MYFLSIQLLNELLYPFHLRYNLSPFLYITFSTLNSFWFVFCNFFSGNFPTISSPLTSLITYIHGTVFLIFLITKTSSNQFATICNVFSNFKFWILIINFFTRVNVCVWFQISRFHFNHAVIYIIICINYII